MSQILTSAGLTGLTFFRSGSQSSSERQFHESRGPHSGWINFTHMCAVHGKTVHDVTRSKTFNELAKHMANMPFEHGGMPGGPVDFSHMFVIGSGGAPSYLSPRMFLPVASMINIVFSVRAFHVLGCFLCEELGREDAIAARAGLAQVSQW